MTTYDYSVTASDIIRGALLKIGAVGESEAVEGLSLTDGMHALNIMVKAWMADGLHLWRREEVVIFPDTTSSSYSLGSASTDAEWTIESGFVSTQLDGAAASAATSLTVDSTASMAVGRRIGIELADGTRQWTTISAIPSSTSITITTALTGAASDDATVFTYTSRPQRPLTILHARRGPWNGSDVPVTVEPLNEYFDTPNKTTAGTITFVSYKPSLTSGILYVWQPVNVVTQLLKLTVELPLGDFDTTSDNPNFPIEWAEALEWNLARRLEPQYRQLDPDRRREIRDMARETKYEVEQFDMDMGSLYIQPNL